MRIKTVPLLVIPLLLLAGLLVANRGQVRAESEGGPTPIVSKIPWEEVNSTIASPGDIAAFSFSATAGQVASVDIWIPAGSPLKGSVRLYPQSTGITVNDAVYGNATAAYNPSDPAGLTAAMPSTDTYIIEVDPVDAGPEATGEFTLRFNLIDPAADITVDDLTISCLDAVTGFVRSAVRAQTGVGTVTVCPGTFDETLRTIVADHWINIAGSGVDETMIIGYDIDNTVEVRAQFVTISDMTLTTVGAESIIRAHQESAKLGFYNCRLTGVPSYGIRTTLTDQVTVVGCEFELGNAAGDEFIISLSGAGAWIEANTFNIQTGNSSRWGVSILGDNAVVLNNAFGNTTSPAGQTGSANPIVITGHFPLVENNTIANYGLAIQINGMPAGSGPSPAATVRNNHMIGSNTRATANDGIAVTDVVDALVENNFIRDHPYVQHGIRLQDSGGRLINNRITLKNREAFSIADGDPDPFPLEVINNTVQLAEEGFPGIGIFINMPNVTTAPITATNNILDAPFGSYAEFCGINSNAPIENADFNQVSGWANPYCGLAMAGDNDIDTPPFFEDAEFHLSPISPAIDAGTAAGAPAKDFEGNTRPKNDGIDIGADEVFIAVATPGCFLPMADTYVHQSNPDSNYGLDVQLQVGDNDASDDRRAYLKFDLSSIPQGVAVVTSTLELNQESGFGGTYHLGRAAAPWDESSLTWNNQPGSAGIYDSPVQSAAPGIKLWETKLIVQEWLDGTTPNDGLLILPGGIVPPTTYTSRDGSLYDGPRLCATWAAPAVPNDLEATGIEVTQGVQDLNNSVRLVEGKPTFVRVYAEAISITAQTYARLIVTRGANSQTLSPINPGGEIVVKTNPLRKNLNDAFLFQLPDFYTAGSVSLTAEINPETSWRGRFPEETDYANNTAAVNVTFEPVPEPDLVVYRTSYSVGTNDYDTPTADIFQMHAWLEAAFPVSEVDLAPIRSLDFGTVTLNITGTFTGTKTCDSLNLVLIAKRIWDLDMFEAFDVNNSRYYAMVDDAGGFMRGCAFDIPAAVASGPTGATRWSWDTDGSYGDWYGGHELAHTYGRRHAEFCDAEGGAAYPYAHGWISPGLAGFPAIYGFDVRTSDIMPATWKDLMTYCDNQWLGDFTYEALMDFFQDNLLRSVPEQSNGPADRILVVGLIDPQQGMAVLQPIYLLPDADEVVTSVPGAYAIVLRDSQGDELARYPFTPSQQSAGPGGDGEIKTLGIAELVTHVAGTAAVEIEGPGGSLLASVAPGASAPAVNLTSPNGGEVLNGDEVTVTWTASDPDGDPLWFNVQYSFDNGANWELLAQNISGSSVKIPRTDLISGGQALLRIWATDGLNTASDESDAPFSVPNHLPEAEITAPADGTILTVDQTLSLEVLAYDADTGLMPDDQLSWDSDIDGLLGQGASLAVVGLSEGDHTIVLTADDGAGGVVTDTVTVTVFSNPIYLPPAPTGLKIGPEVLILDPAVVPTDTVSIDNAAGLNPISWTAVANQSWVTLSATSGSTPDLIVVGFDESLLGPGSHYADIMFTSSAAPGQSITIRVSVTIAAPEMQYLPVIRR